MIRRLTLVSSQHTSIRGNSPPPFLPSILPRSILTLASPAQHPFPIHAHHTPNNPGPLPHQKQKQTHEIKKKTNLTIK